MTDNELMALAAKAAGAKWSDYSDQTPDHWQIQHADKVWRKWNPLSDDCDAMRLAIKLGICIVFMEDHDSVGAEHSRHGVMIIEAMDDFGTRRAIVRAAAAIGKATA